MFRVDGALVPLKNGERIPPDELQKIAKRLEQAERAGPPGLPGRAEAACGPSRSSSAR